MAAAILCASGASGAEAQRGVADEPLFAAALLLDVLEDIRVNMIALGLRVNLRAGTLGLLDCSDSTDLGIMGKNDIRF